MYKRYNIKENVVVCPMFRYIDCRCLLLIGLMFDLWDILYISTFKAG